tara:strand:- start:775 stop:1431 length:657 start_codon:yes stop_codon:yes gene_type:complete
MIHINFPEIAEDHLHYEPFFHVEVPTAIDRKTNDQLHQHYLENATWLGEKEANKIINDVEYSKLNNVKHARQIEFPEWNKFVEKEWLTKLFKIFKVSFPEKFYTGISCAMHGKGTELIPHTDGPPDSASFRNASKFHKKEMTGCIIQHIYILDTDQYPESGMQFHYSDFDDKNLKPVRQVKALPGTYVAYRNTPNSLHGVPEQKVDFKRMLVNLKTFW